MVYYKHKKENTKKVGNQMSFFKTLKKVFTETPDYVPSESYQDMLRATKKKHNQELKQWRKDFRNEQNEKER